MEKTTTIAVGIEMTKEPSRKNYILTENHEMHFLSLTDNQFNFLNWLDNVGLLYDYDIKEVEITDFEKI